jgi:hypothetical protein
MLPPEAIKEFQKIYKDEFEHDISDEEASKKAHDLIHLFAKLVQSSNIVRSGGLIKKNK